MEAVKTKQEILELALRGTQRGVQSSSPSGSRPGTALHSAGGLWLGTASTELARTPRGASDEEGELRQQLQAYRVDLADAAREADAQAEYRRLGDSPDTELYLWHAAKTVVDLKRAAIADPFSAAELARVAQASAEAQEELLDLIPLLDEIVGDHTAADVIATEERELATQAHQASEAAVRLMGERTQYLHQVLYESDLHQQCVAEMTNEYLLMFKEYRGCFEKSRLDLEKAWTRLAAGQAQEVGSNLTCMHNLNTLNHVHRS
jgi:hypothetical protein